MPRFHLRPSDWLRAQRGLLALGPLKATLLLTAAVSVPALLISQAMWLVSGMHGTPWVPALVAMSCAVLITPLVAWPLLRLLDDLESVRAKLDILATRDELTGVPNRRQFLVQADREFARCRRYGGGASFLMIDVDHFKRVNDLHGHLAGDLMLREIGRTIADTVRRPDLVGRFGGEEFTVFLPHTDALGAIDVAERIRERVAALALEWRGQQIRTTVSIGAVVLEPAHQTLGALIAEADLALYAAKGAGRNCVRTSPGRPSMSFGLGSEHPQDHEDGGWR
jgi:diguanylate cyclase (GGDEF)-like protein